MKDYYMGWVMEDTVLLLVEKIDGDKNKIRRGDIIKNKSDIHKKEKLDSYTKRVSNLISGETKFIPNYADEFIVKNGEFEVYVNTSEASKNNIVRLDSIILKLADETRILVDIDMYYLLELLKVSTIIGGKIQDKCKIVTFYGKILLVSDKMDIYNTVENDTRLIKESKKNKTTVYKQGHLYKTLTRKEVYLGKIYRWCELSTKRNYNGRMIDNLSYKIQLLDKPNEVHLMQKSYSMQSNCESLEKTLLKYRNNFEHNLDILNRNGYKITDYMITKGIDILSREVNSVERKTPRIDCGEVLQSTDGQKHIDDILNWWRNKVIWEMNTGAAEGYEIRIDKLGWTGLKEENPMLNYTNNEYKQILNILGTGNKLDVIGTDGSMVYSGQL